MSSDAKLRIALMAALLSIPGVSHSQSTSRIERFDSLMTISRNRNINIKERIELTNSDGIFDAGLRRDLRLKPPNRPGANGGSFEFIEARVDGEETQVATEQSGSFQIQILAHGGSLNRSKHVIELSYTAVDQFTVYDSFEDLNQNITGEWPVPIEHATVELDFPNGVPPRLSISADTGSSESFQFDCVKTNLANGIKFETTHPLAPGARLFISARFMQKGYFVSDAGGKAQVWQKYPYLSSVLWVAAALIFACIVAYRMAPKGLPQYDTAPRWIGLLVLACLPGTAVFALRLIYEQTVMTWRDGEQMVGFALAHAYILFFLPMILSFALAHFALACVGAVTLARWLRRLPTPKWNWVAVVGLAVCAGLVYLPYDFWMITTIRVAGPGIHGKNFLMRAAADGKMPLARILIAKGVSPNTSVGGSTALDVACSTRNLDVAKLLLQQGAEMSDAPNCANLGLNGR
jgi:hypothetical protein